jgi:hypothetical protein
LKDNSQGEEMKNYICLFLAALAITFFSYSNVAFAIGPYTDNGDTIYDSKTRLTWQKVAGGAPLRSWEDGLVYCDELYLGDHADWRLPNIRELISIVDDSVFNPAANSVFQCQSSPYWSSTTGRDYDSAWGVHFFYGDDYRSIKTYRYYVRCVRGGI